MLNRLSHPGAPGPHQYFDEHLQCDIDTSTSKGNGWECFLVGKLEKMSQKYSRKGEEKAGRKKRSLSKDDFPLNFS